MLYLRTAIWVLITLTLNSIAPPCFAGNAKLWNCANTCCHLILLVISLVVRCPNDYKPSSCFFILFVLTSFPTKWELPPPKMYIYFLLMIFSYLWSFALIFLILLLFLFLLVHMCQLSPCSYFLKLIIVLNSRIQNVHSIYFIIYILLLIWSL